MSRIRGDPFRGRQRQPNGFQIAHFADQPTSGSSRKAERKASVKPRVVAMDFALVHQAALGLVYEFDRIFDGDDVVGAVVIAVI